MSYPLANRRALGAVSVFGAPVAAARSALGTASQVEAARAAYEQAAMIYGRLQEQHGNLSSIVGAQASATALAEAAASMNAAAAHYNKLTGATP